MLLGIIILIWSEGGNELNKLLPGVLLFCSVPTPSLSPFEVQENGRIELG